MSQNPFVFLEPVKGSDFYNREEIINKVSLYTVQSKSQGNVWITGERQVGKTSLLQCLERTFQDRYPTIKPYDREQELKILWIYVNCQIIREESGFYHNLTQSLINYSDWKIEEKEKPYETFLHFLKEIHQKGYYILFLLDEFDAFVEKLARKSSEAASDFLETLNVLKQGLPNIKNHSKAFGLICASNHSIGELTENLQLTGSGLNFFQSLELPNFSLEQVIELANVYLQKNPIRFSEEEIQFCYKMTHGYPLFLQQLFFLLYEEKEKNISLTPKELWEKVKKEWGETFLKTIKDWESQRKLPHRTLQKLSSLLISGKEEIKDFGSKVTSETLTKLMK